MQRKDLLNLPMVASSHKTTPKDHLRQKASESQENSLKLLQRKKWTSPFLKKNVISTWDECLNVCVNYKIFFGRKYLTALSRE